MMIRRDPDDIAIDNNAFRDNDSKKIFGVKSNRKRNFSIFLVSAFLLLFVGLLIFEFKHFADTSTPSFLNNEDDTTVEQQDNEKLGFSKIWDLFTGSFNAPEEELIDDNLVEQDYEEIEIEDESKSSPESIKIESKKVAETNNNFSNNKVADKEIDNKVVKSKVAKKELNQLSNSKQYKYALQLMSLEEKYYQSALNFTEKLIKSGYNAYVYRTPTKLKTKKYPNGMHFYRIRIGFFKTKQDAIELGQKVANIYSAIPSDFYVTLPLKNEYNKRIIIN